MRRKLLVVLAGSGLVASAVAAVFPFRSLGPRPGNSLRTTPWRKGRRLVTEEGKPVRPTDLSDRTAARRCSPKGWPTRRTPRPC